MKQKIALVLEGGGMRGAYTAGALSWLIDHDIEFTSVYGISTGAVHAGSYLLKEKDYLYDLSTDLIADKKIIGWRSLLREGRYVGYKYLFHKLLPDIYRYDIKRLLRVAEKINAKIGLYDIDRGETVYIQTADLDENFYLMRAAGTLPIIGSTVIFEGHRYLDGGITDMIPIEEALRDQNEKFLVITTKPEDYVRKPANKWIVRLMGWIYSCQPKIKEQYADRHIHYRQQVERVKELVAEHKAVYRYPSQNIKVSRLKGDKPNLRRLYQLGYDDMEQHKEEILALIEKGGGNHAEGGR